MTAIHAGRVLQLAVSASRGFRASGAGAPDEGAPPGGWRAVCAGGRRAARAGCSAPRWRVRGFVAASGGGGARAAGGGQGGGATGFGGGGARGRVPSSPREVSCAAQMADRHRLVAEAEGAALDGGAFATRVLRKLA